MKPLISLKRRISESANRRPDGSAPAVSPSRRRAVSSAAVLLILAGTLAALAQNYSIDWHTVDGGGGASTGGVYSVSGTLGQPDAGAMSGGQFALQGGFWGIVAAVQTAGLPNLDIRFSGPDTVVVSWPNTGAYTLQANNHLASTNWATYGGAVITLGGTNSVSITPPTGNLFFRLKQ